MQFSTAQKPIGQNGSVSQTLMTPANSIQRPSTSTQISYLNARGAPGPTSHSSHTSPQNMLSQLAFKQVPGPMYSKKPE